MSGSDAAGGETGPFSSPSASASSSSSSAAAAAPAEVEARFAHFHRTTLASGGRQSFTSALRARAEFSNPYILERVVESFAIDEYGSHFPRGAGGRAFHPDDYARACAQCEGGSAHATIAAYCSALLVALIVGFLISIRKSEPPPEVPEAMAKPDATRSMANAVASVIQYFDVIIAFFMDKMNKISEFMDQAMPFSSLHSYAETF